MTGTKAAAPAHLLVLVLLAAFPGLITWLPSTLMR
jgi:hypothetical protein